MDTDFVKTPVRRSLGTLGALPVLSVAMHHRSRRTLALAVTIQLVQVATWAAPGSTILAVPIRLFGCTVFWIHFIACKNVFSIFSCISGCSGHCNPLSVWTQDPEVGRECGREGPAPHHGRQRGKAQVHVRTGGPGHAGSTKVRAFNFRTFIICPTSIFVFSSF